MAEERPPPAAVGPNPGAGFDRYDTEVLLAVRKKMRGGLAEVVASERAGTLHARRKPGAATPKEAGETIQMLLDGVDAVLRERGIGDET